MEIVIHKQSTIKNSYIGIIYETYTSSIDKKELVTIKAKSNFVFAIKLAWNIIKKSKWLESSLILLESKPKKRYYKNKKSNKK